MLTYSPQLISNCNIKDLSKLSQLKKVSVKVVKLILKDGPKFKQLIPN